MVPQNQTVMETNRSVLGCPHGAQEPLACGVPGSSTHQGGRAVQGQPLDSMLGGGAAPHTGIGVRASEPRGGRPRQLV